MVLHWEFKDRDPIHEQPKAEGFQVGGAPQSDIFQCLKASVTPSSMMWFSRHHIFFFQSIEP